MIPSTTKTKSGITHTPTTSAWRERAGNTELIEPGVSGVVHTVIPALKH